GVRAVDQPRGVDQAPVDTHDGIAPAGGRVGHIHHRLGAVGGPPVPVASAHVGGQDEGVAGADLVEGDAFDLVAAAVAQYVLLAGDPLSFLGGACFEVGDLSGRGVVVAPAAQRRQRDLEL